MIKEIFVDQYLTRIKDHAPCPNHIQKINQVREVLNYPPFTESKPIDTFCDLDGVVLSFSLKEGVNFNSLLSLARVAQASRQITLCSFRPKVSDSFLLNRFWEKKKISCWPVISQSSTDRIEKFFAHVAPQTKVAFNLGASKLSKKSLIEPIEKTLTSPHSEAVLIGSSVFDRLGLKRLYSQLPSDWLKRLWYFDTQKIIF
jgi:hypothetical protein